MTVLSKRAAKIGERVLLMGTKKERVVVVPVEKHEGREGRKGGELLLWGKGVKFFVMGETSRDCSMIKGGREPCKEISYAQVNEGRAMLGRICTGTQRDILLCVCAKKGFAVVMHSEKESLGEILCKYEVSILKVT